MKTRLQILVFALLILPSLALAHGGHEHVLGTVQKVTPTLIAVKTASGTIGVPLSPATRYYRGSDTKHPADAREVEPGMRVVIHEGADGKAAEVHIPHS